MRAGFAITSLEELERIQLEDFAWRPIRRALAVTGFGVNAYTAVKAGDPVIEPHDETSPGAGRHEELYVVLRGAAEFTLEGDAVAAPSGSLIRVSVGVRREAVATADETTVLVIGGPPGSALPVSAFEYWYAAQGPYSRGDYEGAIRIASEGLGDYPEHPHLNYQLACYCALAGRRQQALDHFAVAIRGNPQVLEWAVDDADLNSIRDDPGFGSS